MEQLRESGDVNILYQCTREESNNIAESYGVSLWASLKGRMQKELVDALEECYGGRR